MTRRAKAILGGGVLLAALAVVQWHFGSATEVPRSSPPGPSKPPLSSVARLEPLRTTDRTRRTQAQANSSASACSHGADPYDGIRVGATYYLPKRTPLMPHYDPPDPMAAIKQIRYVEGIKVKVLRKHSPRPSSPPWYEVQTAADRAWINGTALAGQCLEEAPAEF